MRCVLSLGRHVIISLNRLEHIAQVIDPHCIVSKDRQSDGHITLFQMIAKVLETRHIG